MHYFRLMKEKNAFEDGLLDNIQTKGFCFSFFVPDGFSLVVHDL